jgi:P27 family predicted phage terminase small subunit
MTRSAELAPAPRHLSAEARAWWTKFVEGWNLDDAGKFILTAGLEAFDRMRGAQRQIQREGLTAKGKLHPAAAVERDARLAMLRALRQLGLDIEPLRDRPGRPPGR